MSCACYLIAWGGNSGRVVTPCVAHLGNLFRKNAALTVRWTVATGGKMAATDATTALSKTTCPQVCTSVASTPAFVCSHTHVLFNYRISLPCSVRIGFTNSLTKQVCTGSHQPYLAPGAK